MVNQTIHIICKWNLCIQRIRRTVDLMGTFWFLAQQPLLPYRIGNFMDPHGPAPYKWPAILGITFQWPSASILKHSPDFPRACRPWTRFAAHLLGWFAPAKKSPALVFVGSTWSLKCTHRSLKHLILRLIDNQIHIKLLSEVLHFQVSPNGMPSPPGGDTGPIW